MSALFESAERAKPVRRQRSPTMDHCAKKSPDAVPPFEGLTRVVEGMECPPGIYFGHEGSSAKYEILGTNRGYGIVRFPHSDVSQPRIIRYSLMVTEVVGSVWFMVAAGPSAPKTTEVKTVANGDRIDAGKISLRSDSIIFPTVVGLKDENDQYSAVLLHGGDFHAVVRPSVLYLGDLRLTRLVWEPFE